MEGQSIFRAIRFPLSHLPTLFLVIGYPIYWLELYVFRTGYGKTAPLAWIIFCFFALIAFFQSYPRLVAGMRNLQTWFLRESLLTKTLLISMGIAGAGILLCAFYASLLPPHLIQESDALNYHITLPRQHLLQGSFSHITWATADLFLLPIDFALTPFWLIASLPNKLPQFFFALGLLGICGRLAYRFSEGKIWPSLLLVLAVLGSHSIGVQMGTALLDIAICYLFLAALDSFLNHAVWLGMAELSFYIWSKPLIPVQFFITLSIFGLVWLLLWVCGIRKNIWAGSPEKIKEVVGNIRSVLAKCCGIFLLLSLLVAGPFIFKDLRFSGTPLFPLGVSAFRTLSIQQSPERWAELKSKATQLLATRDMYGSGRSLYTFLRHFWIIAVPEQGVNNRYDYPMGLMYLLFLGPFLVFFISSLRRKSLSLLSLWVVVSWVIWWLGSQQTRFLFVPLILMYLVAASSIRVPSRILLGTMLVAILLVAVSVYRANKQDIGHWGEAVLRPKDKELILLGKSNKPVNTVSLPFSDVVYATFPVEVVDKE